jgi:hypothetical protein
MHLFVVLTQEVGLQLEVKFLLENRSMEKKTIGSKG